MNSAGSGGMIGVLDSGVGGLSVLRHLREMLPCEPVTYVSDAAWCPYGPKPADVVRGRVFAIVDDLIARGADQIVVACNSASTVALTALRERHPTLPIIGMEPAVKPAAAATLTGAVGVLATATTAHGEALARLVDRFGRGVTVHVAVPEGLVELVEQGAGTGPAAEAILRPILDEWRAANVDVVVLGCTHFPFARATIERLAGHGVTVIDPAPAVARHATNMRTRDRACRAESAPGGTQFLTSGDAAELRRIATLLIDAAWVRQGCFAALPCLGEAMPG